MKKQVPPKNKDNNKTIQEDDGDISDKKLKSSLINFITNPDVFHNFKKF